MLGLGWGEILVLGVVAIIFIGPKQLPGMMKGFAKLISQLNQAREDWKQAVRSDEGLQDIQRSMNEVKDSVSKPLNEMGQGFRDRLKKLENEIDNEAKRSIPAEPSHGLDDEVTEVYQGSESPAIESEKTRKIKPKNKKDSEPA